MENALRGRSARQGSQRPQARARCRQRRQWADRSRDHRCVSRMAREASARRAVGGMTERKSRFGDRSVLPDDPALKVLALRPRGGASDPTAPITYPGRMAAEDQQGLVARLQQSREEAAAAHNKLEKERIEREKERSEGLLLLRLDPESIGLTEFANRHELSLLATD